MSGEVMDVKEVAAYLSISPNTVYKWVDQRRLPFTKVGNLLRFPKPIIDRWLAQRTTHPKAELYERFVAMVTRYHLEKLFESRGIEVEELEQMEAERLQEELERMIEAYLSVKDQDPQQQR